MNTKILVMAGVLVALTGLVFAFPINFFAEGVACPGPMCVTNNGGGTFEGSGVPGWGAPDFCNAVVYSCGWGTNECCDQCFNWGYETNHMVGVCKNVCNLPYQFWERTCEV